MDARRLPSDWSPQGDRSKAAASGQSEHRGSGAKRGRRAADRLRGGRSEARCKVRSGAGRRGGAAAEDAAQPEASSRDARPPEAGYAATIRQQEFSGLRVYLSCVKQRKCTSKLINGEFSQNRRFEELQFITYRVSHIRQ